MFNSERVCGKHFASGKPAPYWHKHAVDWVPPLQLAKKGYRAELDHNANAERAEMAKKRYELGKQSPCCSDRLHSEEEGNGN